ncbi:MAG: PIN domain-containing protein [Pyrobaculum sp.]
MRVVVDSNVYRALRDQVHHNAAREILEELSEWITPTLVIYEVVWTLRNKLGNDPALEYTSALLTHRKLVIVSATKDDIMRAIQTIKDEKTSLARFNDKLLLAIAKRLKIPLLTFDKQLITQATRVGC